MRGPCFSRNTLMRWIARSVASTCLGSSGTGTYPKTEGEINNIPGLRSETWAPIVMLVRARGGERLPHRRWLEEAELLRAVAHEQILGLLIVIEHHAVSFTANAGLFVSAECGVGGVGVIAVDPNTACLNAAAQVVAAVGIPTPQACAEPIECVVGDFERIGFVLERRHRNDGSEDFF